MKVERKNSLKKNQITHLKIKITNLNYCKIVNIQKLLLNEDNNNQTVLQERIKNANKTYFMLQTLFKNEDISKKLQLRLKKTTIDKMLTYASETGTLTNQ